MAINIVILEKIEIPESYTQALPKAIVGVVISYVVPSKLSADYLLDCLEILLEELSLLQNCTTVAYQIGSSVAYKRYATVITPLL